MKRIKTMLAIVLALCMLFTVAPMAFAEDGDASGTVESVDWAYSATDKTITVTGNINNSGTIPYLLANNWSSYDYDTIIVNEGITEIIANGLNGCKAKEVILPKSLRVIGDGAFKNSSNLINLCIPEGVTTLGNFIVDSATALTSIYIPSTVTTMNAGNTLYGTNKTNLKVYLPDGWTWRFPVIKGATYDKGYTCAKAKAFNRKADGTFEYNASFDTLLAAATSGDTVISIANLNCSTLPTAPEGVNVVYMGTVGTSGTWKSQNWTLDALTKTITLTPASSSIVSVGDNTTNSICEQAWSSFDYDVVVISEGFTSISNYGLLKCKAKNILLPSTLDSIGEGAFQACSNLKYLELPVGFTTVGNYPFKGCNLDFIFFPHTLTTFRANWWDSLTVETVYYERSSVSPDYIQYKAGYLKNSDGNAATLVSCNTKCVSSSGDITFGQFKNVVNNAVAGDVVTLLDSIDDTQYNSLDTMPTTFNGTKINYLSGVKIETRAKSCIWSYEPDKKSITLTCTDAVNGTIGGDNYAYPTTAWKVFDYNKLIICEGIKNISNYAFSGLKAADVVFPSTLKTIGQGAFRNSPNLNNVDLPVGLETIGQYAFQDSVLNSIYFPATVTTASNWLYEMKVSDVYYSPSTVSIAQVYDKQGNLVDADGNRAKIHSVDAIVEYADETVSMVNLDSVIAEITSEDKVVLLADMNSDLVLARNLVIENPYDFNISNVFYLDTNGNDSIDITDLVRMKKYIVGDSVEINTGNLNFNEDMATKNLAYLRKYLLGITDFAK